MRSVEADLLAIKHSVDGASTPCLMFCTAKATAQQGVPTVLRLLNVTVARSSNLILDVNVETPLLPVLAPTTLQM